MTSEMVKRTDEKHAGAYKIDVSATEARDGK